jgi:hypothetical protein
LAGLSKANHMMLANRNKKDFVVILLGVVSSNFMAVDTAAF